MTSGGSGPSWTACSRFDELPREVKGDLGGDQTHHDGPQFSPQIIPSSRFEPRLMETLYARNATAVARQLLGGEFGIASDAPDP